MKYVWQISEWIYPYIQCENVGNEKHDKFSWKTRVPSPFEPVGWHDSDKFKFMQELDFDNYRHLSYVYGKLIHNDYLSIGCRRAVIKNMSPDQENKSG